MAKIEFGQGGLKAKRTARFDLTKVDTENFLEVMKVENLQSATEEEWMFSCPFPGHSHGDQSPSAYMNKETTAWMCHGCKRSGNAITFYEEYENVSRQEARAMLQKIYGGRSPDPDEYSVLAELERMWAKAEREKDVVNPNVALNEGLAEEYALDWEAAWKVLGEGKEIPEEMEYMFGRGFPAYALDEWDIGWDQIRERIMIPTRNAVAQLVGFKGRAIRKEHKPKYLVMGGDRYDYPRFEKSQVVFGLDRVIAKYMENADVILCEGELDVISLHAKGFDTAVCLAGSSISDQQARLLRRWSSSVTIFFDTDEGGEAGTVKVIDALEKFIPVRVVPDHEGDPAEMGDDEISRLIRESETAVRAWLIGREGE